MILIYIGLVVILIFLIFLYFRMQKVINFSPLISELSSDPTVIQTHNEIVASRKIQIEQYGKQQRFAWVGLVSSLTISFLLICVLIGWVTFGQNLHVKDWPTIISLITGLTLTTGFSTLYNKATKEYNTALDALQEKAFEVSSRLSE